MISPLSREAGALKRAIKRVFVARGAFSLRALASYDTSSYTGRLSLARQKEQGYRPVVAFHPTLARAQGGVARSR